MTAAEFVSRLDHVRPLPGGGYRASCPAHPDNRPSLTVRDGYRGTLIKCWTGCKLEDIAAARGLRVSDLFHKQGERSRKSRGLSRPSHEWGVVWAETVRRAVEQGRRQTEWAPLFFISHFIRRCHHTASVARVLVTAIGEEDPGVWPLLEGAARVEVAGLCAEAEVDAIIADGRIDGGRW